MMSAVSVAALNLLSAAAATTATPPAFATEYALDYRVDNLQYGFVVYGRWTVDHQDSAGRLNLRERTDSYNASLQPRAEVKDFGHHKHYEWFDKTGYPPCLQNPLNGTQPAWVVDPSAKLITNAHQGPGVQVWRVLHASISQCVDFYVRAADPRLPFMLLYFGNCTSATARLPGEVLGQNNSYWNFSFHDIPDSRFKPSGPCPPSPPPAAVSGETTDDARGRGEELGDEMSRADWLGLRGGVLK